MEIKVREAFFKDGTIGWKIEKKDYSEEEWNKIVKACKGVGLGKTDIEVTVKDDRIYFSSVWGDMDEETVKKLVREMINRVRRMDSPKELVFII